MIDELHEWCPMSDAEDEWIDPDIRALELSWSEKAGLQIYRNYTRSFEDHAVIKFREALNRGTLDLSDLKKLVRLLAVEDSRFLPVITCGYADELLKRAFRKALPPGIPGGIAEMFRAYGPLSDLSKRIRLAFAFDVLSADLMEALDRVRSARNRISHDWDLEGVADFHLSGRVAELFPVEALLSEEAIKFPELASDINPLSAFRIRLIWLVGRLTYEAEAYYLAKKARLSPVRALYGAGVTTWLASVAAVCMSETRAIIRGNHELGA